jgi:predicted acylesterase/phospholipase RssA
VAKRSLILAGGGLKVGFQAGVLQVWLDEAALVFDHADGASGGCLNLAMYCQGLSGTAIADNWRNLNPFLPIALNLDAPGQPGFAESIFTLDNFRRQVLPAWGIDFNRINQGTKLGTFNVLNYSKKQLATLTQDRLTEDLLIASVSLPMWFPPVVIDGERYMDAVFVTDANVEEAIRRGADEIWAIWTVSTRDEYRPGFVAQYFHIIEASADTNFFGIWRRLEASNARIAAGEQGEFGRHIELRLLQAEVPVHYLFNLSRDRMAEAVNLGVQTARAWCDRLGIPRPHPGPPIPPTPAPRRTRLQFTEQMKGHVGQGAADFVEGERAGIEADTRLDVTLTIHVADVDRFMADPNHPATITGTADSPLLGGVVEVSRGAFNLLVQGDGPQRKEMRYRLHTRDAAGPVTIVGVKKVEHDQGLNDVFADTTTLFVTMYRGHVEAAGEAGAEVLARGIIRIGFFELLQLLTTFRTQGPTLAARNAALARYGALIFGKLWEVYGPGLGAPLG